MASGSSTSLADPDWLVGSFSRRQAIAALWIGSVGLLILGLQPILLGAMFTEGRVSLDELAVIATAEILTIAIGSAITSLLISTRRLTMKSVVLLIALAALNCAMSYATSAAGIVIVRSLAGLVEGAMVAVSIELIARSTHAERLGGYFVTLQTLAQSLLALALALWVVPMAGSSGGFLLLAVVCLASVVVAFAVPAEYGDLPRQPQSTDGVLTVRSILCLLSIFAFFLCIGAIWAFLEPLGARTGIDAQRMHRARDPTPHRRAHIGGRDIAVGKQIAAVEIRIACQHGAVGQRHGLAAEATDLLDREQALRHLPGGDALDFVFGWATGDELGDDLVEARGGGARIHARFHVHGDEEHAEPLERQHARADGNRALLIAHQEAIEA